MAEPTVQVPVSLIERAITTLDGWAYPSLKADFRALLSQPTPTAEPEVDVCFYCLGAGYHDGGDMRDDETCNACRGTGITRLPRIEDMAVGTTFLSTVDDHNTRALRFMRTSTCGAVDQDGTRWPINAFDPSTIRDVTPPKETP